MLNDKNPELEEKYATEVPIKMEEVKDAYKVPQEFVYDPKAQGE